MIFRTMVMAPVLSGAVLTVVSLAGHFTLSEHSDDVSPAHAAGIRSTTLQVDAQDIELGKHWGN
jgi:hypothetical protein